MANFLVDFLNGSPSLTLENALHLYSSSQIHIRREKSALSKDPFVFILGWEDVPEPQCLISGSGDYILAAWRHCQI